MAGDYFTTLPNYVNPQYVTPEQIKNQLAYADALTKRSGQDVQRPTGAFANMIDALTGVLNRNATNSLAGRAAEGNANDYASALMQMNHGQNPQYSASPANPVASAPPPMGNVASAGINAALPQEAPKPDETNPNGGMFGGLGFKPVGWDDQAPVKVASLSPAGGGAAPAGAPEPPRSLPANAAPGAPTFNDRLAQLDPALLGRMAASPMASPEQRAFVGRLITPEPTTDVYGRPGYVSPAGGVQPAQMPPTSQWQPGIKGESSISRSGISGTNIITPNGGQSGGPQVPGGIKGAMDTMNTLDTNANNAEAVGNIQKADIAAANDAPTIKRVAGVMLDDLRKHGDQMTWGPTAEWSNNVRRVAANYAPGFMKDQLETLASADSFDKMSAQLTSMLARGGGTDAQLFNNMKSVPGSHNSKEGADALLQMTMQVADQQQALRQYTSRAQNWQEYQTLKDQFYKDHPIINPITGNPIQLDLNNQKPNVLAPDRGAIEQEMRKRGLLK